MRPSKTSLGLLLLAASPLAAQQPVPSAELLLSPGDSIHVLIWREEDLSGGFLVDSEGRVVLPMLGPRDVTGRPWLEVRDELVAAYQNEGGLRNPSISLTPLRRVYVLGEVNLPGPYSVDPSMSLAGAIAMAGGTNPQGNLKHVQVVRNGETIIDGVAVESALAAVGVRSGDQIFVGRRSWFERNSTFLITAALSATSVIVTILATFGGN
jgi:polysaccharide export outer membrane protein